MPRSIQSMKFLNEEERDVLQEVMDEQASQEKKHKGERTLAGYWSKIRSASANPITFAAAAWGFFYFWAYVSAPLLHILPGHVLACCWVQMPWMPGCF
jgi:hypothetical protein